MNDLRGLLMRHEGLRLMPYVDTQGRCTIGCGRCLDTTGITAQEALYLLENDIMRARAAAATFAWFPKLDPVRQDVITSMIFNLGLNGFCAFKKLIACMALGDFSGASIEMLASVWASQIGKRAVELASLMRNGVYLD